MNFLLMLGMMGLMLMFFHGRGHHKPSSEPNHHAAKPAGSRPAQPAAPKEPNSPESSPDTAGSPEAESTPPPPPAPKGE